MRCPCCYADLQPALIDGQIIDQCEACEGWFASHSVLRAILVLHAPRPKDRGANYARPSPLSDPVRYRKCPTCTAVMLRKNFAGASGVVVDVCPVHGIWFDRGELETIVEFAATGAMRAADRNTLERSKARKRLDAWLEELRLGTPQHGAAVGGLGEIARIIPHFELDDD